MLLLQSVCLSDLEVHLRQPVSKEEIGNQEALISHWSHQRMIQLLPAVSRKEDIFTVIRAH